MGYLCWRKERTQAQARAVSEILSRAKYGDGVIERVRSIIRKQRLYSDPEVQTYEGAVALVFLETQPNKTTERLGSKIIDVLAKTFGKITPASISVIPELPTFPFGNDRGGRWQGTIGKYGLHIQGPEGR